MRRALTGRVCSETIRREVFRNIELANSRLWIGRVRERAPLTQPVSARRASVNEGTGISQKGKTRMTRCVWENGVFGTV